MTDDQAGVDEQQDETIRIGVSSCLLGEEVRFDGGHKRDAYINGTLSQYFEFVPVCPEVAVGLGTPRQPIHLVARDEGVRAVGTRDPELDVSAALRDYGRQMAEELGDISGYILKNRSPSCGMERVKVYPQSGGAPSKTGRGLYAEALMDARPLLPVEEEGRLGDPVLRENFIERVLTFHRWQSLRRRGVTPASLVEFHTRHKLAIMAHSLVHYRRLGRLIADAGNRDVEALADDYVATLMEALRQRATRRSHANVLSHLQGYLKDRLDAGDKAEMVELIEAYRQGRVPLIVPVTLLNHHFRRHPVDYVANQTYLQPHPPELMLRNQI